MAKVKYTVKENTSIEPSLMRAAAATTATTEMQSKPPLRLPRGGGKKTKKARSQTERAFSAYSGD